MLKCGRAGKIFNEKSNDRAGWHQTKRRIARRQAAPGRNRAWHPAKAAKAAPHYEKQTAIGGARKGLNDAACEVAAASEISGVIAARNDHGNTEGVA
jgi:hypothetical protein